MSYFGPLRELLPVVRPRAADELALRWIAHYDDRRHAERPSRIWADHLASVADYWDHKRRHPDTHAGAMVIACRWVPVVLATASMLTINPIILVPAVLALRRRERGGGWLRPRVS